MQRIAILGGGIGALTTAFELTNDPNWKDNYDITIYQLGWRVGGKGASGRNTAIGGRIEEHGLHIWMGFYENSFHMLRKAYDECRANNLMPGSPFQHIEDAFLPVNYTPVMEQVDGKWKIWPITWPSDKAFPGEDSLFVNKEEPPTPWGFALMLLDRMIDELEDTKGKHPILASLYKTFAGQLSDDIGRIPQLPPDSVPESHSWLHRLGVFAHILPADPKQHDPSDHEHLVVRLRSFVDELLKLVWDIIQWNDDLRRFVIIVNLVLSTVIGMLEDHVITQGFMVIEQYEATEWLQRHGCMFADSAIVRGMYDSAFSYIGGDSKLRKMGAGSMLYGALRLMLTYRGSFMWHMGAGMGETVMTPIYLALRQRGVKFALFHKVTNVGLSADKSAIDSIDIDVQCTIKPEYKDGYEPLFTAPDGIPCWPTEPFWEQIVEAEAIQKASNHDLESWWNNAPIAHQRTLRRTADFDLVVLGISLGAFRYVCPELIDAKAEWRDMVQNIQTVRTQGLQLWLNRTTQQVGWTGDTPVLTAYLEPFDTWSDMSYLIKHENWPPAKNVQQIAYFCNAMLDDPNQPPFRGNPDYPEKTRATVMANAQNFVGNSLSVMWPQSVNPATPKVFNWDYLVNCTEATDPFASQFFKSNIDPTERYVLSLPGTAFYRLSSGNSGFSNLYLAGDWTLIDINVGCIEAAVISGRMASQAICGKPDHVYGSFGYMLPIVKKAEA